MHCSLLCAARGLGGLLRSRSDPSRVPHCAMKRKAASTEAVAQLRRWRDWRSRSKAAMVRKWSADGSLPRVRRHIFLKHSCSLVPGPGKQTIAVV